MSDPRDPHHAAIAHLRGAHPRLGAVIDHAGPCRLPPPGSRIATNDAGFEAVAKAIVGQQLSGKAAATIFGRVRALGEGGAFPAPGALAAADDVTLRAAGLSAAKARSVKDLAARVAAGALRFDDVHDLDDEAVIDRLVAVKGVGRWTAEMVLMFSLGRPDVLPVADLGVRKGLVRLFRLRADPDAAKMQRLARPFAPYRSVLSWYLWRLTEMK